MRILTGIVCAALAGPGGVAMGAEPETRAVTAGLENEVRALSRRSDGPIWASYAAPQVEGHRRMCCWDSMETVKSGDFCCGRCNLEGERSWSVTNVNGSGDGVVRLESGGSFLVVFRVGRDGVDRVRAFSEGCHLDSGRRPFVRLTGVDPETSLQWLASLARDADDEVGNGAVTAIALHAGSRPDEILSKLASAGQPRDRREQAIFWMGQTRGRAGYETVKRYAESDPDTDIRRKAIFSMSQSEVPEATGTLIRLARHDRSSEVRAESIFWLAQVAGRRAVETIKGAVDDDPEMEVKKKAVFALSQLPAEEGVPLLIEIARGHRLSAVRKEAIFWLGQSGDPRALDFIEEILKG